MPLRNKSLILAFSLFMLCCPESAALSFGPAGADKKQEETSGLLHPVTIIPHRAVYSMSLASVKKSSSLADLKGSLTFEWGDSCDGWPVQQHLQLRFTYAEGDDINISSSVTTWEAKNGGKYHFNVRRTENGKEKEIFRGRVTMGKNGGIAKYTLPDNKKDIPLSEETLFPSAHTKMVLEKAAAGNDKFFSRRVFDGSDEKGQSDISVFIGGRNERSLGSEVSPDLRDNPLLASSFWPVRLAFFDIDSETGEPDYEMNMVLQENGIARSLLLEYKTFSISGVLKSIEALPAPDCSH